LESVQRIAAIIKYRMMDPSCSELMLERVQCYERVGHIKELAAKLGISFAVLEDLTIRAVEADSDEQAAAI